jgi:hypothetical protein
MIASPFSPTFCGAVVRFRITRATSQWKERLPESPGPDVAN